MNNSYAQSQVLKESFIGNGEIKTFTLEKSPTSLDYVWIKINNVYQKSIGNYTLDKNIITFTEAPSRNAIILIEYIKELTLLIDTDFKGAQGPRGPIGPQGAQGEKGIQGERGFQGERGLQGIQGEQGPLGPQGERGLQGPKGSQGVQGIQGPTNEIDLYLIRKKITIDNNQTTSILSIFGQQMSGSYRLFDLNDPRTSATVFLKHNSLTTEPDIRVDTNSSSVSITENTSLKLNIFISSNLVQIENMLARTCELAVYREI